MNTYATGDLCQRQSLGKVFDNHFPRLPQPGRRISGSVGGLPQSLSQNLQDQPLNCQIGRAIGFVKFMIQTRTEPGQSASKKLRRGSQRKRIRS